MRRAIGETQRGGEVSKHGLAGVSGVCTARGMDCAVHMLRGGLMVTSRSGAMGRAGAGYQHQSDEGVNTK